VKVLSAREARVVAALAETMFPEEGVLLGARGAGIVEAVDAFMAAVPRTERVMMRAMFALFEVGIGVFGPGRRSLRFSRARNADRTAYVAAWEASDLYAKRLAFQALRSTFLIAYFQSDAVHQAIGVDGGEEVVRRWNERRRALQEIPVARPKRAARGR
jgi:hypothetical protein